MKKTIIVLLIIQSILCFCACDTIEEDKAKTFTEEIIGYIEDGDYQAIDSIFYTEKVSFEEFLEDVEAETPLDFQSGIEITEYISYSEGMNSYFGLYCCSVTAAVLVGGKEAEIELLILEDEGVYILGCMYITYDGVVYQQLS